MSRSGDRVKVGKQSNMCKIVQLPTPLTAQFVFCFNPDVTLQLAIFITFDRYE